ncbi:MAG: hypothetical protein Q7S11_05185 [bacterium]|nr:hypothetical protein [bacterium]
MNQTPYIMKDTIGLSLIAGIIFMSGFVFLEPTVGLAVEDQVVITQTVTSGISISSPADVTMSQALTVSADTSVGTSTWTVTTNNVTGYTLSVSASSTSPCPLNTASIMRKSLCDISTASGFTDIATTSKAVWSVTSDYAFGYSAFGNDTTGHGTGSQCSSTANVPSSTLLYQGFNGTTLIQIASSSVKTGTSGTATNVCYAVEQDAVFAPSGTYKATTTATAVVQ